jgi:endo-1,4-beta-mannosidase
MSLPKMRTVQAQPAVPLGCPVGCRGGAARAGWNLINEPRSAKANGAAEVQAWVAEVAPFVKALAPRQLVTIGEDGFYQAGNCEAS